MCFNVLSLVTDGDQRDDEEALQGRGRWIGGSVGQLCGDRRHVREGRFAP